MLGTAPRLRPELMQPRFKNFIKSWIINTLAVAIAVVVLREHIRYASTTDLLIAALLLGVLNAFVRPILMLLSLPLLIFSLGLFTIVINGCLLYFVHALMGSHFEVDSFGWAMLGALIIGVVSLILNILTGNTGARIRMQRGSPPGPPDRNGKGNGPVIDI
jgi:putative membrane protein